MRFFFLAFFFTLLVAYAMAVPAEKQSVIISYPNDTPQSVVDDAIKAVKDAGGKITHVYNIIKGFACEAPVPFLENFRVSIASEHQGVVEEDQPMHANNGPGISI
ncbi:hypothetical protein CC78DRAFT_544258 [Lojkania enalia]|uniref:Inhibitor I9 domain-containing protein n=1 Tax=Lojkania enalia TaxID=147567 RepID=A0A9P4N3B1_9PLEO|nr:hypothetical protein CC78DRAFT_544258 [Didymosphaeria enalia]